MRLLAVIIVILGLAGCASPGDYARPQALELDVLDSLTVVFVDPDTMVHPNSNLMTLMKDGYSIGICYWDEWDWIDRNLYRGVWVMSRKTPVYFACDAQSIRDSLTHNSISVYPDGRVVFYESKLRELYKQAGVEIAPVHPDPFWDSKKEDTL